MQAVMLRRLFIFCLLSLVSNAQYQFSCTSSVGSVHSDINSLREEIANLRRQVGSNSNDIENRYRILGDGWVTLFNGYQYKKTPARQSWQASRTVCQRWGGDLAVYGIQDMGSRRLLLRALSIQNPAVWIGMSDVRREGDWFWVNGERIVRSAVMWAGTTQPDDHGGQEDCGEIRATNDYGYGSNDHVCSIEQIALCEKPYPEIFQ